MGKLPAGKMFLLPLCTLLVSREAHPAITWHRATLMRGSSLCLAGEGLSSPHQCTFWIYLHSSSSSKPLICEPGMLRAFPHVP